MDLGTFRADAVRLVMVWTCRMRARGERMMGPQPLTRAAGIRLVLRQRTGGRPGGRHGDQACILAASTLKCTRCHHGAVSQAADTKS